MKIFIADDSAILRERLVSLLSAIQGVEIIGQAENVPQALQGIQQTNPEAVILDIQMPGGSGMEVLQQIKQQSPETLVVMLTNHPWPQYKQKCFDLGANYFFSKSTGLKDLLQVVTSLASA